jgi:hypothetical protein
MPNTFALSVLVYSIFNFNPELWVLACFGLPEYSSWFFQLLLPFVLQPVVICACGFSLWWQRYLVRMAGQNNQKGSKDLSDLQLVPFWKLYLSFNILLLTVLHIPMLIVASIALSCIQDDGGQYTMVLSPSTQCFTLEGEWLWTYVVPSLVVFVVYCLGTIALYGSVLWLHHERAPYSIQSRPRTRSLEPFNINCFYFPPRFWWWKLTEFGENLLLVLFVSIVPYLWLQCTTIIVTIASFCIWRFAVRSSVPSDYIHVHWISIMSPIFMFSLLFCSVLVLHLTDGVPVAVFMTLVITAVAIPVLAVIWVAVDVRRRTNEARARSRLFEPGVYASAMKLVLERMYYSHSISLSLSLSLSRSVSVAVAVACTQLLITVAC